MSAPHIILVGIVRRACRVEIGRVRRRVLRDRPSVLSLRKRLLAVTGADRVLLRFIWRLRFVRKAVCRLRIEAEQRLLIAFTLGNVSTTVLLRMVAVQL